MLTFLPLDRIQQLEGDMQQSGYKPNTAQRLLAEEVIRFVHGEEGLSAALLATQVRRTLTLYQGYNVHYLSLSPSFAHF